MADSWDVLLHRHGPSTDPTRLHADGVAPRSPDGSRIAFTGTTDPQRLGTIPDVLVLNLADGSITNLTNDPAHDWGPVWSRDGGKIAFLSYRDGSPELYVMEANGATPTRVTHNVGFTGYIGSTGASQSGRRTAAGSRSRVTRTGRPNCT